MMFLGLPATPALPLCSFALSLFRSLCGPYCAYCVLDLLSLYVCSTTSISLILLRYLHTRTHTQTCARILFMPVCCFVCCCFCVLRDADVVAAAAAAGDCVVDSNGWSRSRQLSLVVGVEQHIPYITGPSFVCQ